MRYLEKTLKLQKLFESHNMPESDPRLKWIGDAVFHFAEARGLRKTYYAIKHGPSWEIYNAAAREHRAGLKAYQKVLDYKGAA